MAVIRDKVQLDLSDTAHLTVDVVNEDPYEPQLWIQYRDADGLYYGSYRIPDKDAQALLNVLTTFKRLTEDD